MDPFNSLRRVLDTAALQAALKGGVDGARVELMNEPFTKPPVRKGSEKAAIYVSFWYRTGGTRQAELGGRRGYEMTVGIYQFDIMVPEAIGTGPGVTIGDAIRRAMNRREKEVAPDGHLKLLMSNVKTPFTGAKNGYFQVICDGTFHFYHRDPNASGFRD